MYQIDKDSFSTTTYCTQEQVLLLEEGVTEFLKFHHVCSCVMEEIKEKIPPKTPV